MNLQIGEKRRETRREADGAAHVRFADPYLCEIEGRLIDISDSGFRMSHACVSLAAGQVVEFSHSEAAGQARVMWNRVIGGRVESGFLVVK